MIGLGSNRLTVCRRGGMSVTQAGRGGMEWLAGVRVPRWASPYSAQATAALKAQFPTQWPTIRDYGFAHPEIVGYMNAYAPEDAKIAYSLVEGIGTRWLVDDGDAYIHTLLQGNQNTTIKSKVRNIQANGEPDGILFSANVSSGWNGGQLGLQTNASWTYYYFNFNVNTNYGSLFGQTLDIEIKQGKIWFNGTLIRESSYSNFTTVYPFNVFAGNWGGTMKYAIKGEMAYWELGGDWQAKMIPFKRNGAMGMIDLLTGTFYGNANSSGAFTESIESPS